MKEVVISKTAKGVVKASTIINSIQKINERYELSKKKASSLFNDLDKTNISIHKTNKRFFGGYSTSKLHDLISESLNSNLETTKTIYDLISNNNENSKQLSEMIKALAMLSGLSFEKIAENSSELDKLSEELESSTNNTGGNSINIKRVVISQIKKLKEEKKRQENIDYNFGILNENLKELQEEVKSSQKNIKNLFYTTSEKHFLRILKKQKRMIYSLFFMLFCLIVFSFYIFFANSLIIL